MIVTCIIGGLGNQMFQYATGRSLSLSLGTTLKLDTRGFFSYKLHQGFELERLFSCHTEIATDDDLRLVLGWQRVKLAQRLLRIPQLKNLRYKSYVVEPHFNYWDGVNNLKDNVYLDGYWQSEKYFHEFADKIREDFTFKLPFSNQNADIADQIDQVQAVSLHVRRGDYVNNAKTSATHGLCSLDYYRAAIQHIIKQVENPHFFVFSDDIAWVKNNLKIDSPHQFVDHNSGEENYNDMRLMSLCKHNIIANSSFSWWAAWLNNNPQKIVIAPQNWFSRKVNVSDLMPYGWIRI